MTRVVKSVFSKVDRLVEECRKWGNDMVEMNCHACGGRMNDRRRVAYRVAAATVRRAAPHQGACTCPQSVLDGPPPGFASMPAMPGISVDRDATGDTDPPPQWGIRATGSDAATGHTVPTVREVARRLWATRALLRAMEG